MKQHGRSTPGRVGHSGRMGFQPVSDSVVTVSAHRGTMRRGLPCRPWRTALHTFAVVSLSVAGCGGDVTGNPVGQSAAPSTQVQVARVVEGNVRIDEQLAAIAEAYETAHVMSKIDGYVASVSVDIGDEVSKGDLLAELDVPEMLDEVERRAKLIQQAEADTHSSEAAIGLARARLEEHQSMLKLRKSELGRVGGLVEKGAMKEDKLEEARYAVEAIDAAITSSKAEVSAAEAQHQAAIARHSVAQADLKKSQSMADYRKLIAPFDGIVTDRMVDTGDFVLPATHGNGKPLFQIAHVDSIRLVVFLTMDLARQLDIGDTAVLDEIEALPSLRIESIGGAPLSIARFSKAFDKSSGMMRAEMDIDNVQLKSETGMQLKPGDYGKLLLTLESYAGAPTVPQSALGTDEKGNHFVMQVDQSNTCRKVPVEVACVRDEQAVLTSGVQIGDRVVVKDLALLEDQQKLEAESIEQVGQNK